MGDSKGGDGAAGVEAGWTDGEGVWTTELVVAKGEEEVTGAAVGRAEVSCDLVEWKWRNRVDDEGEQRASEVMDERGMVAAGKHRYPSTTCLRQAEE